MKEMPVSYHRILNRLESREEKLLSSRRIQPFAQVGQKLEEKIPPTLENTLRTAFRKAFALLLGPGGTKVLDHTYPKEKLKARQELWAKCPSPAQAKREVRRLNRQRREARVIQSCVSGAEGTVLGVLGIGLPDIPILLGTLLRSIYETAAAYGFSVDSPEERTYLLLVLQGGVTEGEERRRVSARADALGRAIDHGWDAPCDPEQEMEQTADLLAQRMLLLKFVQGIPVAGAVGGAGNLSMSSSVANYAAIKYQKRFLEKKVRGL